MNIDYHELRQQGVKDMDISDMYFNDKRPSIKPSNKSERPYDVNIKKELTDIADDNTKIEIEDKE